MSQNSKYKIRSQKQLTFFIFFYFVSAVLGSPAFRVLEPEAVRVPDAQELLLDDGAEELAGTVHGLQHAADVHVHVVDSVVVHGCHLLQQLGPLREQRGVDVRPVLHSTKRSHHSRVSSCINSVS